LQSLAVLNNPEAVADQEPDIVARAVGGDRPAFEELYHKYVRKIYNLVYRMVGSAQEAEEVTQEVFYQAYKNLTGFQGRSKFYTWIFRIATNVSLQYVKRQSRHRRDQSFDDVTDAQLPPTGTASGTDPEKEVQSRALYRALDSAVRRLPPNQRAVMILGPIQGHSYEQMAQILGTNEEVIKGRLHRARENIREFLKEDR
jgi:RNA polymerase sigma-70 factor (ECF subfamily)